MPPPKWCGVGVEYISIQFWESRIIAHKTRVCTSIKKKTIFTRNLIYPSIGQGQNSGLHSRIYCKQEVGKKSIFSSFGHQKQTLRVQITQKISFGYRMQHCSSHNKCFVHRQCFESNGIGLHCQIDHGKCGDSGVLQSINISSDSPSAISDSCG